MVKRTRDTKPKNTGYVAPNFTNSEEDKGKCSLSIALLEREKALDALLSSRPQQREFSGLNLTTNLLSISRSNSRETSIFLLGEDMSGFNKTNPTHVLEAVMALEKSKPKEKAIEKIEDYGEKGNKIRDALNLASNENTLNDVDLSRMVAQGYNYFREALNDRGRCYSSSIAKYKSLGKSAEDSLLTLHILKLHADRTMDIKPLLKYFEVVAGVRKLETCEDIGLSTLEYNQWRSVIETTTSFEDEDVVKPTPEPDKLPENQVTPELQNYVSNFTVFFDKDDFFLNPFQRSRLQELLSALKSTVDIEKFIITGHTNRSYDENITTQRGALRANHVADVVLGGGYERYQISEKDLGNTNNLDNPISNEGKARNRRVEIAIYGKTKIK